MMPENSEGTGLAERTAVQEYEQQKAQLPSPR